MKKYLKFFIPILFALAILLGLIQHRQSIVYNFSNDKKQQSAGDKSLADYFNTAQQLSGQTSTNTTVSFLAVGDISLSRNVALAIQKAGDVDLPFEKMANVLKSTDFNFANLESPVSPPPSLPPQGGEKNNSPPLAGGAGGGGIIGGHSMVFSAPGGNIKGLINFNFKILNLANNHAFDQGLAGLDYTRKILDSNNIEHEGTGDNLDQAWQPAVVEAKGMKICFVGASYASANDGGKTTNNYVARIEDLKNLQSAISNSQSICDFVVVTMHAGTEYTRTANAAQIKFAHAAIDYGADVVIGAHPHWIQNIEKYCPHSPLPMGEGAPTAGGAGEGSTTCPNPKYIFYSLGNFIFDQEWSRETKEGLALKMTISKSDCHPERPQGAEGSLNADQYLNLRDSSARPSGSVGMTCGDDLQGGHQSAKLEQVELVPVIIENNSTPRPATAEESKKILEKINQTQDILLP